MAPGLREAAIEATKSNVNVDPRPTWESTTKSPPINCANFFEIASPRPVPPYLRVVVESTWLNARKSRSLIRSDGMPIPVSFTDITIPDISVFMDGRTPLFLVEHSGVGSDNDTALMSELCGVR